MNRSRIAALLAACAFVAGCRQSIPSVEAVEKSKERTCVARRGEFRREFILTGELDARESIIIAVPMIPTWETSIKWLAEGGTQVREGDKVAELDNSGILRDLEKRREAVRQARSELARVQAKNATDLAQRRFDLDRAGHQLHKARVEASVPPDILTRRDFERAQLNLRAAEVAHAKAKELLDALNVAQASDLRNQLIALQSAERDAALSEAAISELVVRSPSDGIILLQDLPWEGRPLQVGDIVWVGFDIARIPNLSKMRVVANLWDVDDGQISVGNLARVVIDAYPEREYSGKVTFVAPVAQEVERLSSRRAFRIVIDLDQSDLSRMRPGLSVRATVLVQRERDALLVSRAAVDWSGKSAALRTRGGESRAVRLGPCNAMDCVVEDGLVEGDELALASVAGGGG